MADDQTLQFIVDALNRVEEKIDAGIGKLEGKLDGKADKADLARIEGELSGHAKRITALEREDDLRRARADVHEERDRRSFFSRKNKWAVIGTVITVAATVTLAIVAVAQLFHG